MEELIGLEKANIVTKSYRLPSYIKPCITALQKEPSESGTNEKAFLIAVEYQRIGKSFEQALTKLDKWNQRNIKQLSQGELQSTLKSAYSGKYEHGCNNKLSEHCAFPDKDLCNFYRELKKQFPKRNHNRDFIKYGWPKVLSNADKVLYYMAIPEVEKRLGFKPGSQLYVTYRQLIDISGLSSATIRPSLERLANSGLITLKIGLPRSWLGKATEIKRVIPIPKPTIDS